MQKTKRYFDKADFLCDRYNKANEKYTKLIKLYCLFTFYQVCFMRCIQTERIFVRFIIDFFLVLICFGVAVNYAEMRPDRKYLVTFWIFFAVISNPRRILTIS